MSQDESEKSGQTIKAEYAGLIVEWEEKRNEYFRVAHRRNKILARICNFFCDSGPYLLICIVWMFCTFPKDLGPIPSGHKWYPEWPEGASTGEQQTIFTLFLAAGLFVIWSTINGIVRSFERPAEAYQTHLENELKEMASRLPAEVKEYVNPVSFLEGDGSGNLKFIDLPQFGRRPSKDSPRKQSEG